MPDPSTDPAAASPGAPANRQVLFRNAALTDARTDRLQLGMSVLVDGDQIAWIRPSESEEDPGPARGLSIIDAAGSTIVPGMVDGHSHFTGAGGAHWMQHWGDDPVSIVATAAHNAALLTGAGVRWARDVGSPIGVDPVDGRRRALSLGV